MVRPVRPRPGRARSAAALASAALLLGLGAAVPAAADPSAPSSDDVREARENQDALAGSAAQMEVELATLGAAAQAAVDAAATAGEHYVTATVELEAAQKLAAAATTRLDAALARAEESRKVLVGVAIEQYRSGGGMKNLEAVLSADGITEVIERTSSLDVVGAVADTAVQQYRADSLVAQSLQSQADASLEQAEQAASVADDAFQEAQDKQEAADDALAAGQTRRAALIASLAAARNTTTALERERQDALDAQRTQKAEKDAEREREEPADPVPAAPTAPTPTPTKRPTATPTTPTRTPAPATPTQPTNDPATPPAPTTPAPTTPPTAPTTPAPAPTTPKPTTPAPTGPALGTGTAVGTAAQGLAAVEWAKKQVGLPYGWGSTGPAAYDCSGLTMKAWASAGVGITRTSRTQYQHVKKITYAAMRPGDLIFYASDTANASTINHVAMYAGGGTMVEAARPGVPLRVTAVRYTNSMPYVGRP